MVRQGIRVIIRDRAAAPGDHVGEERSNDLGAEGHERGGSGPVRRWTREVDQAGDLDHGDVSIVTQPASPRNSRAQGSGLRFRILGFRVHGIIIIIIIIEGLSLLCVV